MSPQPPQPADLDLRGQADVAANALTSLLLDLREDLQAQWESRRRDGEDWQGGEQQLDELDAAILDTEELRLTIATIHTT